MVCIRKEEVSLGWWIGGRNTTYIHLLSLLLALSQPGHQILNLRHRAGNQLDAPRVLANLQFSQLCGLSVAS